MKKFVELTESKGWAFWTAAVWSGLAAVLARRFLLTRELIKKEIFSDVLGNQHLMADGLLTGMGILLAIIWWRKWFLHGKKIIKQMKRNKRRTQS